LLRENFGLVCAGLCAVKWDIDDFVVAFDDWVFGWLCGFGRLDGG
jgi:hypothetical protein